MYIEFFLIFLLTAAAYELGFAQKIPILKKVIVYFLLFAGTFPLTILNAAGLPMIPVLCVAVVVLLIARYRQKNSRPLREKEHKG
jgi:Ca2+/Na+ antiporter